MRRAFKYKVKINKTTEAIALNWLQLCRDLYNAALEQRIIAYHQRKKQVSYFDQTYQIPDLKKSCPEYNEVDSHCLYNVLKRLDSAFQNFFRRIKNKTGKPGFPRFKGKNRYDSFTLYKYGWKLDGRYLHIKKIGTFKLYLSRPIEGIIKTITIQRTKTGNWFVSFSCDKVPAKKYRPTNKVVGIDVGVKNFCTDSDNNIFDNPRYFNQSKKLLRRRQRSFSRKKKGSQRRNKARILVAKAYEKITNQRQDFLHKVSNYYIDRYNKIYVEKININDLLENNYTAKYILDVCWGKFFDMLSYKAEEAGRKLIKVAAQNSSEICSNCGEIVKKSLGARYHKCPSCNIKLSRDFNAALNILRLGQSLQAQT